MSVQIDRSLAILELLATEAKPLALNKIASHCNIPKSGCHRILLALVAKEFVKQVPTTQHYELSLKVRILGLGYLAKVGIKDVCYPELHKLASQTGELSRLAVLDHENLYFVSEAKGKAWGLQFDPNLGRAATLHATASGKAWLATLSNEEAVRIVLTRGFGKPYELGPNVIRSVEELLEELNRTRKQGIGIAREEAEPGVNAVSAAIIQQGPQKNAVGCVIIVAPAARMNEARIEEISPLVKGAARRLGKLWPLRSYTQSSVLYDRTLDTSIESKGVMTNAN